LFHSLLTPSLCSRSISAFARSARGRLQANSSVNAEQGISAKAVAVVISANRCT
jgi:hypothetical protein